MKQGNPLAKALTIWDLSKKSLLRTKKSSKQTEDLGSFLGIVLKFKFFWEELNHSYMHLCTAETN